MLKLIAIPINIAVFLCGFWTVTMLSVLLHEFGHAIGFMLAAGDRNWHIEVGQGKKLLDTKALTINLLVLDGSCIPAEDKTDYTKTQRIIILSGGPIMSLLLVAGLSVLTFGGISISSEVIASGTIRALFFAALIINSLILLWSVIPAYGIYRGMEDVGTDVMQIIDTLKRPQE